MPGRALPAPLDVDPLEDDALQAASSEGPASAMDQARLGDMVAQHFAFVWRSLRRFGVHEADVDDLAQRVFLTASRKLALIRPGAERSFLFAVATREAGHARRSYQRRAEVGEEAIFDKSTGGLRPDEQASRSQALSYVQTVLEGMSQELRTVFVLFEVEEMSCEQIAQLLEIPLGTVKSRLRRAREDFALRTADLRKPKDAAP